jgi:YEATS domain-containing protein 4
METYSPAESPSLSSSASSSSLLASPALGMSVGGGGGGGNVARVKGALVERPVIYGNISWWLGKKADDTKTHRWTTYVRGPHNEDLSYFIKKVVFTLHPSFPNPVRGTHARTHARSSW